MQISIPVIGLLITWIIGAAGLDNISNLTNANVFNPVPYFFGIEYRALTNIVSEPIKVSNCDKWFFVDWGEEAIKATKEYFGKNDGIRGSETNGMINGNKNVLMSSCNLVDKNVPYFKDWEETNEKDFNNEFPSIDHYLFKHIDNLHKTYLNYSNHDLDENLDVIALPDAIYTVHEANSKLLKYDARVNDIHYWQYHRDNGFSKIGIVDKVRHINATATKVFDA